MERGDGDGAKARGRREVLTKTSYEDETGRKWVTLVPQGQEGDAAIGIPLGPPDTRPLGLPEAVDLELNKQLFKRGLITKSDVRKRPQEVLAALQAALRADAVKIMNLYKEVANAKFNEV